MWFQQRKGFRHPQFVLFLEPVSTFRGGGRIFIWLRSRGSQPHRQGLCAGVWAFVVWNQHSNRRTGWQGGPETELEFSSGRYLDTTRKVFEVYKCRWGRSKSACFHTLNSSKTPPHKWIKALTSWTCLQELLPLTMPVSQFNSESPRSQ